MPIQNYAAAMGDAAQFAQMPVNALIQGRQRQAQDARIAQADQQRNVLFQQGQQDRVAAQTQDDEEDAAWDQAYAAKDWATLARIDPQTTKILYEMENPQQKQAALPSSVQEFEYAQKNPGFQQYQDRNRQGPQPVEPPSDQRLYNWYAALPPEQQQAFLNMKRSSATPEAAGAIAGAKTTAQEQAKAGVAAQGDLPSIQGNASEMRKVLGQLKDSDGLRFITGSYALAPVVPGTPQADAYAVWEQLQGKAFLEAFNSLKGGGQITEKEGEKATAAITRLSNRKQSLKSFNAAIKDLEDVVAAGEQRAQQKAGKPAAAGKRLKFDANGNQVP
jgi:hypothetical protein